MKIPKLQKNPDGEYELQVKLRGEELIHEPLLNKGTGFTARERREFGLEGLLPSVIASMDVQAKRVYDHIKSCTSEFQKYIVLSNLHDRNEHVYYRVLLDYLDELMPVVYTPTVGEATQQYSRVFRRGRGMWITPEHKGRMESVLSQVARQREVSLLVVTDSESILGIGDQGAGGMAISIGKLSLYCVGAGIHPAATLPVCLDFGTNNQALLEDEYYVGWPHQRLKGDEYRDLIEEFVDAVKTVFPGAMVQWEDFRKDNALEILERYRTALPSFNDDIQGTGAVALAGVLSALRVSKQSLAEQRIVIHGAGAAGLGIARQLRSGFIQAGVDESDLTAKCAVLDSRGLLIEGRTIKDAYKQELAWDKNTAAAFDLYLEEDLSLETVVEKYKPTVLIGSSGQAGAFSESIVRTMAKHVERPIILPFSNPTSLAEARPASLYQWTDGRCLVATGSPFDDVTYGEKTYKVGQGNNVFVFPGIGMAALISQATQITDAMISTAAAALADSVTAQELDQGLLFPSVARLREVSELVTKAVTKQALKESVCASMTDEEIEQRINNAIWEPSYPKYVPV
ncbi:MAG: NAD-dependent malic enzyme [Pseudomonadota bacterium]